MRACSLLLGVWVALCSIGATAGTDPPRPAPAAERRINLNLNEVPLRQAVAMLFQGSDLQYSIDPNVPNVPITLNIRGVSAPAGLRLLVRQASVAIPGLTTARDGEVHLVKIRAAPGVAPPSVPSLPPALRDRKVTLNLRDVPLRTAVDALFQGSGAQYTVEPNVPNVPVTLVLREIGLQQGLRLLLRQAAVAAPGLTSTRSGDVIVIRVIPPAVQRSSVEPGPSSEAPLPDDFAWERIPLRFTDVTALATAMGGRVFAEAGDLAAAPGRGPAPEIALDGEFSPTPPAPPRAAPRNGAARRGGDYPPPHLRLEIEIPSRPPGEAGLPAGGSEGLRPTARRRKGIAVPAGVEEVVGLRSQNALLVRGTAEGIERLKRVVRLIDVPQRQFRLRISAGAVAAEGQVLNNSTLSVTDVRSGERLAASLTPRVNGDGSIDVRVEGILRLADGEHPLQSQVRVRPGAAVPVITLGDGPRARRVWLRAVPVAGR